MRVVAICHHHDDGTKHDPRRVGSGRVVSLLGLLRRRRAPAAAASGSCGDLAVSLMVPACGLLSLVLLACGDFSCRHKRVKNLIFIYVHLVWLLQLSANVLFHAPLPPDSPLRLLLYQRLIGGMSVSVGFVPFFQVLWSRPRDVYCHRGVLADRCSLARCGGLLVLCRFGRSI